MPELWDQLTQQPVAEPLSLWPGGDRAPLRITVGGPTMKDGAQASPGSSLDPFNPPQVEHVGRPIVEGLAKIFSGPSWLQRATEQSGKDQAAFQAGGVPGLMADTSGGQELAGGFGGTTTGKLAPALMAAEAPAAAPAFYSALMRSIEGAKLNKASPDQWLGYLRNQPGVKAEEIDRVLGNLPKEGMLTKPDMQAHAAENAVTLGETNLGDNTQRQMSLAQDVIKQKAELQRLGNEWDATPAARTQIETEMNLRHDRIRELENESAGLPERNSKYDKWQLPGGENYREKLLTLPTKPTQMPGYRVVPHPDGDGFALKDSYGNFKLAPQGYLHEGQPLRWDTEARAREGNAFYEQDQNKQNFKSSHWDEPNVLAHMRMNDREVPGVGKSLHLEEIQSDWHQKGRTAGYQKNTGDQDMNEIRNLASGSVPDAPFKPTWPDVALKRAIRDAAEGGYDALSWTPGEAQAARYDLSKHIKKVTLSPVDTVHVGEKVKWHVEAIDHNNNRAIEQWVKNDSELADIVGKETAEKLLANKHPRTGVASLSGLDLKVGGEGMKAFYDKMLVDKANALGKKHGARVEPSSVPTNKEGWHITPPEQTTHGKWMVKSNDYNSTGLRFDTEDAAKAALADKIKQDPVHVLRITPQLREAAMKGFPLFSALFGGAATAPSLWPQEGRQ